MGTKVSNGKVGSVGNGTGTLKLNLPGLGTVAPPSNGKKPKPPIKVNKHRPYWGGYVLGTTGLKGVGVTGITPDMVGLVSKLTNEQKPNNTESLAWLKICYNIVHGYLQGVADTQKGGNTSK